MSYILVVVCYNCHSDIPGIFYFDFDRGVSNRATWMVTDNIGNKKLDICTEHDNSDAPDL